MSATAHRGRLVSGGRLQVPADVRRELQLVDGDTVSMRVVDGELRIRPTKGSMDRIRAIMRKYVPEGVSLADALIADRRAEAERD